MVLLGEAHTGSHSAAPQASVSQLREEAFYKCYSAIGLISSVKLRRVGRHVPAQPCSPSAKEFLFTDDTTLANNRTNTICSDTTSFIPALTNDYDNWQVGAESCVGLILHLEFGLLLVFLELLKSFTHHVPFPIWIALAPSLVWCRLSSR